jgi:transcriptional regulator with XRE-family HTH domain
MTDVHLMDSREIVARAQGAVGGSQKEFAAKLGASRRTFTRWIAGESSPSWDQLVEIVRMVHPIDAALAFHIAANMDETLESLGVTPRAPPSPSLVEVVSASAEANGVPVAAVRTAVVAALTRANELGLGVEEALEALVTGE